MSAATRRSGSGAVPRTSARATVLAAVLAAMAWQVSAPSTITRFDESVRGWVLDHQFWLLVAVLRAVTNLGNALVVVPLFLVLTWVLTRVVSFRRGDAALVVRALSATGLLVVTVAVSKAALGRTGPSMEPVSFLSGAWPSGHTATATVVYGLLALWLRDQPATIRTRYAARGLVAVPVGVAAALVYCDFHWLSDVVGGFLLGVLVLVAAEELSRRLLRSRRVVLPLARRTASQNRS